MKLLFICTHNRCRSILAEAVTNHLANGRITAASAGSSPQDEVHPMTFKYLGERDISIAGLASQSWNDYVNFTPDAIVTLCDNAAQETCPVWFDGTVQVHWSLSDPSKGDVNDAQQRVLFNDTIGVIEKRIKRLLEADLATLSGSALREKLTQIAAQVPAI